MIIPQDLINEAKAKMGREAAIEIARDLGFEQFDERNLKALCYWHKEDTPSLSWYEKKNYWKCFGCNFKYDIIDHYMSFRNLSFVEAAKLLFEKTNTILEGLNNYEYSDNYFRNYKYPKEETNTDRGKVEEYLAKRGISSKTLDYAGVKQDKYGNIVFEHRDINGRLLCTKYRNLGSSIKKTAKTWWQKYSSTCPILYGINKVDTTKPLLIVEGHVDRLSCIEAGYFNTVSIPHGAESFGWIDFNWHYLEDFESIILWGDNDSPGEKFVKEASIRLGEHRCRIVEPNAEVENKVKKFWNKYGKNIDKTDANNVLVACGKQTVLDLINNAEEIPIPDVIRLMECEEFDIKEATVLPTGIKELDSHIFGYIEGSLNIWTGRTGGGKSTFIIQSCLNEAINVGEPTFIYSGELTKEQLKNWIILQLAGRDHIIQWDNGVNKPKTYTVTHLAKEKIEKKYMDYIYIYDSYLVATPEKVISTMEYVRKRYGVRNFVIDNLMCFDLDIAKHGNEWNAQKNLIIQFLQFAIRYNSIIHLVAHPRKPDGTVALDEYSILGSSNIPNLAHRIFILGRMDEEERGKKKVDHHAYVGILKDRVMGVSKKYIGLYYDEASRRLRGQEDNKYKRYSWDDGSIIYKGEKFGDNGILVQSLGDEDSPF